MPSTEKATCGSPRAEHTSPPTPQCSWPLPASDRHLCWEGTWSRASLEENCFHILKITLFGWAWWYSGHRGRPSLSYRQDNNTQRLFLNNTLLCKSCSWLSLVLESNGFNTPCLMTLKCEVMALTGVQINTTSPPCHLHSHPVAS